MKPIDCRGFHFYEGDEKWLARGVTYGPFKPDGDEFRYPTAERVQEDMAAIAASGANAIRLYDLPPEWLVESAASHGLRLLIDLPWPKHLDVYGDKRLRRMCLDMVEESVSRIRGWKNLLGVFLGNEISSDFVRWQGTRRIELLLREMYLKSKALAPHLPIGYANYPSTEYLELRFFDFLGFNVYLDDPEVFRAYMVRLRHLYPEKPILLSECGMDSLSAGDGHHHHLAENLRSAFEAGMAGTFVFAWTDEWHTGGHDINDWAFGLVDVDRQPKPALEAVSNVYQCAPQCRLLSEYPKVSVVVATYNGGRTLAQCLRSLSQLEYPNYEVIVVDDGSTDDTPKILSQFPRVRVVSQPNSGLSVARNSGIKAARGRIIAFTDSDCVVDKDWVYHLVRHMRLHSVDGVGGPNITPPEDRLVQQVVALAPGHATHVLLSQEEAEHVPGCNMAFTREALLQVGGFDPVFRKAGDDVDVIWRMQDAGVRIGFSTAAFVWHHRRPTLRGYLRQQRGYGEADALVLRKHPHRFDERGQSIWRGVIYSSRELRPLFAKPAIRFGVFGTAGYQCVYERTAGSIPFYVTSLEWWLACVILVTGGLWAPVAFFLAIAGMAVSLAVSGVRAAQNVRSAAVGGMAGFLLVWALWVLQPLMRGGARYWHWLRASRQTGIAPAARVSSSRRDWPKMLEYWSEHGHWRVTVLDSLRRRMAERQWLFSPNNDWQAWDLSVPVSWWFKVLVTTAEEHHGGEKRLLRVRFSVRATALLVMVALVSTGLTLLVTIHDDVWGRWIAAALLGVLFFAWRNADLRRVKIEELADEVARESGYLRVRRRANSKRGVQKENRNAEPLVSGSVSLESAQRTLANDVVR
jgi:O-antigen biosynthesis protein